MLRLLALLLLASAPAAAQDASPVAAAVQAQVDARYPDMAGHLVVRAERVPDAAAALNSPRVSWTDRGRAPNGPLSVAVTDADGRAVGRARVFVARFDSVVSVSQTLRKGDDASAALTIAWTETTRLSGNPLTARDLPPNALFATRHLRAGRTLRTGDLRSAFAADIGDAITMRYRRGGLSLDLRGHAREAGHVGDAIRLHVPDTNTTYRVRLMADGVAHWVETL
jgi:flagella basal body P-ring formation protein FlgA